MSDAPSPEEVVLWQRRLAAQANNRAWRLSESSSRSPQEDEEMLQAAHASSYFWRIVGNAGNKAHAAQLLAHVYALLKLPNPAAHYFAQAEPFFFDRECEPWELACAHAVKANVAASGRPVGRPCTQLPRGRATHRGAAGSRGSGNPERDPARRSEARRCVGTSTSRRC